MFIIEYGQYGKKKRVVSTNVKDIHDIMIGIINDKQVENEVVDWAGNANFGDNFVNQRYRFIVKCVYSEDKAFPVKNGKNKETVVFEHYVLLQEIADEITNITGIKNEFIGKNNGSLTWKFKVGSSYMNNMENTGLKLVLQDKDGKVICEVKECDRKEFIRKASTVIKRFVNSRKNGAKINHKVTKIEDIKSMITKAEADRVEFHHRVYDDGCWWIDMEMHPYGQIRFWVGFEDKRSGRSNGSLFTVYDLKTRMYGCEFKVKKAVEDRIFYIYNGLMDKKEQ